MNKKTTYFVIGTIVTLALSRLLPHPHNFTPLGGIAILGAAYFQKSYLKYIIPVVAFYLSDVLVSNILYKSFYPDQSFVFFSSHMAWNYLSILCIVLVAGPILKQQKFSRILGGSVIGAVLFFLISNFGAWMGGTMYAKSLTGLISCYIAGIPFFGNTLASFVLYSVVGYWAIEYIPSVLKVSWATEPKN